MKTEVTWKGGFKFESVQGGHTLVMDSNKPEKQGAGPSPKPLLLSALAGCTGMDVVYILNNYGYNDFEFKLEVDAENSDKHPKIYSAIKIKYQFSGENLSEYKLKRAVELSATKYCGVSAMLRESSEISFEVYLNGDKVE